MRIFQRLFYHYVAWKYYFFVRKERRKENEDLYSL